MEDDMIGHEFEVIAGIIVAYALIYIPLFYLVRRMCRPFNTALLDMMNNKARLMEAHALQIEHQLKSRK